MRWPCLPLVVASALATTARAEPQLVVAGKPARLAPAIVHAPAFGGWRATWDRDTGVPRWLTGTYVAAPGTTHDAAAAERAARNFLAAHVGVLAPGAVVTDFTVVANQLDGATRSVGFQQTWHGLDVVGGQLGFVFAHDRLFAISDTALPNLHPTVSASRASRARAETWITAELGRRARAIDLHRRVVLPIVRSGGVEAHVADVFDVEVPGAAERWDVYLAADGTPLARRSTVMTAASGTLSYNAGVRYASGPRADYPAVTANVTIAGGPATTASDGTVTWPSGNTTIAPTCAGTSVVVGNMAGAAATTTLPIAPGGAATWNAANVELDDAQVSTYVYANLALARARVINPGLAFLAGPVSFYVNENVACNASSNGTDIHLSRATAACENTGRIADIVFHELGHALHFHSIIPGMGAFEAQLTEGLADFNAANLTEDSGIGRGLDYTDKPTREIDPPGIEKQFPADVTGDPHLSGEIISGALWDLRKALVAQLGHDPGVAATEQVFLGVMRRAPDMASSYQAALIGDDDDGDLGNGTPHLCAIERAFGIHGLVTGFEQTIVSSPVVDQLAISVAVTVPTATTCAPRHVTGMHVLWKVDDNVASELFLEDHGDTWTGSFPEQREGAVIAYSVDVTFDDGSTQTFPNNPADPLYQTFVGTASVLYCQTFDHDPQWTQGGTFADEWEWGMPNPIAAHAGDPLTAHTGTKVLGTNVVEGGAYRPSEQVYIATPEVEVTAYQLIHLQYWRWLSVEDGMYDQAEVLVNDTSIWHNASAPNGLLHHVDREWRFHDLDLTPYVAGGTATVKWQLTSDDVFELGGWTLDDACIVGLTKIPKCGDLFVDYTEQCDDGNVKDGDGCSSACKFEIDAGGGGCSSTRGEAGPVVAMCLIGLLRRRVRSSTGAR